MISVYLLLDCANAYCFHTISLKNIIVFIVCL